jgi:hypothetical protein
LENPSRPHLAAELLRLVAVGDNAAMEAEPPKRKRRWFQFSLRSLLIFTVLCAIGSALLTPRLQQAQRQKTAVEGILEEGGVVWYDYEVNSEGNHIGGAERPGPAWLHKMLGDDFFADAVFVEAKPILQWNTSAN